MNDRMACVPRKLVDLIQRRTIDVKRVQELEMRIADFPLISSPFSAADTMSYPWHEELQVPSTCMQ